MKTNEIKKGATVMLRNGWMARMEDNRKTAVRLALVYGDYTEMGSVYAHDILKVRVGGIEEGHWVPVEHTEDQMRLKATLERIFNSPKPQPKSSVWGS
jgi:hypothetical protein